MNVDFIQCGFDEHGPCMKFLENALSNREKMGQTMPKVSFSFYFCENISLRYSAYSTIYTKRKLMVYKLIQVFKQFGNTIASFLRLCFKMN